MTTATMQALWQTFFQEDDNAAVVDNADDTPYLPNSKRPRVAEPSPAAAAALGTNNNGPFSASAVLPPLAPKPAPLAQTTQQPSASSSSSWMMEMSASSGGATYPFSNYTMQQQQQQQHFHHAQPIAARPPVVVPVPAPAAATSTTNKPPRTEHRKRKNAEYARVTRERKRNQELLLNLELASLERENERLKALVKTHLPEDEAQTVIGECCYTSDNNKAGLFAAACGASAAAAAAANPTADVDATANPTTSSSSTKLMRSDFELIESLTKTRQSFVLTDPRLPDNPIVYASRPFLALTGYSRQQVLGRNCRILQGIDTDPAAVAEIRKAVAAGKDGAACLLNYKADGTPFWNQFFVAPLRDKAGNLVNYVGVQHKIDKPEVTPGAKKNEDGDNDDNDNPEGQDAPQRPQEEEAIYTPPVQKPVQLDPSFSLERSDSAIIMKDEDMNILDWAELAQALEGDYDFDSLTGDNIITGADGDEDMENGSGSKGDETLSTSAEANEVPLTYLEQFFTSPPREFVARTIRSDLIDILLNNHGDITDRRFLAGLDVLSELFKSSINFNTSLSAVLNGSWRSISRPMYHYGGCVGMNDRGDFVYTLGKMCFNMFKPGNVRVTVQHTMNHIEPVCRMDKLPSAAPWSLRRELALQDPSTLQTSDKTMLKSYDVVVALTIEPGEFNAGKGETVPSPARRLKALQVARGYFLPDPETPNRLTVWFTGGELAPAPLTEEDFEKGYGGLDDWVEFFGAEYKRTWSEALSDMGAKLFLGAELPNEMDPNGKMEYTLHRPYGGHGKGHADVMYVDGDLLITKGQSGSIHVMVAQK